MAANMMVMLRDEVPKSFYKAHTASQRRQGVEEGVALENGI